MFAQYPRGEIVVIECSALTGVDEFTSALFRKAQLQPLRHYVVHAGARLTSGATLGNCGVRSGATLVVVPRLDGGVGGASDDLQARIEELLSEAVTSAIDTAPSDLVSFFAGWYARRAHESGIPAPSSFYDGWTAAAGSSSSSFADSWLAATKAARAVLGDPQAPAPPLRCQNPHTEFLLPLPSVYLR